MSWIYYMNNINLLQSVKIITIHSIDSMCTENDSIQNFSLFPLKDVNAIKLKENKSKYSK